MDPDLLYGGGDTRRWHNILGTSITPFDVGQISLLEDGDSLPIDKVPVLSHDYALKLTMGRIALEHVDHIVEVNENLLKGGGQCP